MTSDRQHFGLLNSCEQAVIRRVLPQLHPRLKPDHLTLLAVLGAFASAASLCLAWYSAWFIAPFLAGLALHWFGDSFDGALARHRKTERPRVGFLIDRSSDLVSLSAIILGLAASPYLLPLPGLLLLAGYLVNAYYGLMRHVVDGQQSLAFGGFGATEGRALMALWVVFMALAKIDPKQVVVGGWYVFTPVCLGLFIGFLLLFCARVFIDVRRKPETTPSPHAPLQAQKNADS